MHSMETVVNNTELYTQTILRGDFKCYHHMRAHTQRQLWGSWCVSLLDFGKHFIMLYVYKVIICTF